MSSSLFEGYEYQQIDQRIKTDIRTYLPGVDPRIYVSILNAVSTALAGRQYDNVLLLQKVLEQSFPQTATGEFLDNFLRQEGLIPLAPTSSAGSITVTGDAAIEIPKETVFSTLDELQFYSTADVVTAENIYGIASLIRVDDTVTGITVSAHSFATGLTVTIAGADQAEYNGEHIVTALSATTFSYTITGSPVSPATGTITASYIGASVPIESEGFGSVNNLISGAVFEVNFTGLDATAYAQIDGLNGGSDAESAVSKRRRTEQSRHEPVANFNEGAIKLIALEVPNVTRVWVKKVTPYVGACEVYFMQDLLANPFPDAGEIEKVRAKVLSLLPVTSAEDDIFIYAPAPLNTSFNFTFLTPDTKSIRKAIEENLRTYFASVADFEITIYEDEYRSIITDAVDEETGEGVKDFTLTSPVGDINPANGEIPALKEITF